MKNQVFVCSTLFHVFVSLAYYSKRKADEQYYLVLSNDIQQVNELKEKIQRYFGIDNMLISDDISVRADLKKSRFSVLRYKQIIKTHLSESLAVINSLENLSINLFIDCTATARYLLYQNPQATFTLLEDGSIIYLTQKQSFPSRIKTQMLYGKQKVGRDAQILQIKVADPNKVPADIKHKTTQWELPQIMKTLSEEEKINILSVFLTDRDFLIKKFDAIIITQPISEDGYVTEDEKLKMYQDLYVHFKLEGKKVLIKTHPREKSNYQLVFPQATVVTEFFPVEILDFFPDFKVDLGITIFSSAIHNINFIRQKEEVGIAFFPKLYAAVKKVI